MKFKRQGNFGDCSYFLANRGCFFHRFSDSGFRTKWTGFWGNEKKFLDYFALKVNGEWLSSGNIVKFEYDFSKAVHYYKTNSGLVKEIVFVPKDAKAIIVELECEKPAEIEVNLAVNIRILSENETSRKYDVEESGRTILVKNELGSVVFNSMGECEFARDERYEIHAPSGERQSYFSPGRILFSGKKIAFSFGPDHVNLRKCRELLESRESFNRNLVKDLIKTDNETLLNAFNCAVLSIELLKKENGYFAGLPWFQQCWGRDTFWSLPALIDLGYHREARNVLEFFAKHSYDLCIPNFVSETQGNSFNSIDATLLWLTGLEYYVKNSGDAGFLRGMEMYIRDFLSFLFARERSGFLQHDFDRNETWMDTQRRCCMAVEIQSLYYRALHSASCILKLLNNHDLLGEVCKRIRNLELNFDKEFFMDGFYADRIDNNGCVKRKTANALVPLIFGPGRKSREILPVAESDKFVSKKGLRTLASDEPDFDPAGYHNGSVWSLTTAWASAAEFLHGRTEKAWEFMTKMTDDINHDALGCIGECWDSNTSRLTGCSLQLWGAAFLVRLLDEFMLGIEIDAIERSIKVSPKIPREIGYVERMKFIGKEMVLLRFKRRGSGISVTCSDPGVKLIKK